MSLDRAEQTEYQWKEEQRTKPWHRNVHMPRCEEQLAEARRLLEEAISTLRVVAPGAFTGPNGLVTRAKNFLESKP